MGSGQGWRRAGHHQGASLGSRDSIPLRDSCQCPMPWKFVFLRVVRGGFSTTAWPLALLTPLGPAGAWRPPSIRQGRKLRDAQSLSGTCPAQEALSFTDAATTPATEVGAGLVQMTLSICQSFTVILGRILKHLFSFSVSIPGGPWNRPSPEQGLLRQDAGPAAKASGSIWTHRGSNLCLIKVSMGFNVHKSDSPGVTSISFILCSTSNP